MDHSLKFLGQLITLGMEWVAVVFRFKAITTSQDEDLQHLEHEVGVVLASQSQLSRVLLECLGQLDDVLALVVTREPTLDPGLEPVILFDQ